MAYMNDSDEAKNEQATSLQAVNRPTEGMPVPHDPTAVFDQKPNRCGFHTRFKFLGWYRVIRIEYLEPYSPGLIQMLDKKWAMVDASGQVRRRERPVSAWQESLGYRWAVLKLQEDEETLKLNGKPSIQKSGVNQILAEMRMRDKRDSTNDNEANCEATSQGG